MYIFLCGNPQKFLLCLSLTTPSYSLVEQKDTRFPELKNTFIEQ